MAHSLAALRDLPGPGIEPVSPALAGFLTTAPPGKSLIIIIFLIFREGASCK